MLTDESHLISEFNSGKRIYSCDDIGFIDFKWQSCCGHELHLDLFGFRQQLSTFSMSFNE